jgi:Protein of unknown function (DUF3633)./LIM domain.
VKQAFLAVGRVKRFVNVFQHKQKEDEKREQTQPCQRQDQNEDAKLARALQEEENKKMDCYARTRHHNNQDTTGSWIGSYPGQRRGQSLVRKCATCNGIILLVPLVALGNFYHPDCFRCIGCHDTIQEGERFASMQSAQDGKRYPLHSQCYAELYGLKCTVCEETIESEENLQSSGGRVSYLRHPFFDAEYMCPKHRKDSCRTCTGCSRFEPMAKPFANLHDADRCICDSCLRSVIVDNEDAKPLWDKVVGFFQNQLKLPLWPGMKDIPVLIVGYDALNQQEEMQNYHQGSSQIMTRGLCLSEHQRNLTRSTNHSSPFLPMMATSTSTTTTTTTTTRRDSMSMMGVPNVDNGYTYLDVPDGATSNPNTAVTAILCLTGLPADLTASILAHEATHAWIKLHPNYNVDRPLPPQVEEGCCQLIAMLFLTDGLECHGTPPQQETSTGTFVSSTITTSTISSATSDYQGPSDKKLRQYFQFSIETDSNEIYGEGYRKAAKIYAEIGIEALLSHVVNYQEFPNI